MAEMSLRRAKDVEGIFVADRPDLICYTNRSHAAEDWRASL